MYVDVGSIAKIGPRSVVAAYESDIPTWTGRWQQLLPEYIIVGVVCIGMYTEREIWSIRPSVCFDSHGDSEGGYTRIELRSNIDGPYLLYYRWQELTLEGNRTWILLVRH